ncbi:hydrogenase nickel incorporation protein HypB [Rubrivivax gelatinosus]|uniref:hydrogenase nickel incorporation protein HypB n=1 Tax=Rubrivivax gelatinosus TaxID=28068 RepID=UPI0003032DBB|nr:hydrogenase nickel incorporation protein HypB [Rubrivivax gelatinosus]MBG6080512.1 hydrogenase nickel incorporation protein HypB [Rubrivivax gelatinosus]
MCGDCGCVITSVPHEHGPHTHGHEHGHGHDHHHHGHEHDHAHGADGAVIPVTVLENILADNDARASHNRARFGAAGVLALNLMSSPGSGKTRWLETTADALGAAQMAVIEGDLETENDAERLRAKGVAAHQITTGMACHLDAAMVARGADALDLATPRYLFIENVGNLVCPASFDLGQHANVVLLSVTEGDDKPLKYPVIFRAADLVLITKADLAPLLDDFDIARATAAVHRVQPAARVIVCSARSGEGLQDWLAWLAAAARDKNQEAPHAHD